MKTPLRFTLALVIFAGGSIAQQRTVLEDVRIIDGTGRPAQQHMSIMIDAGPMNGGPISGGNILEIVPSRLRKWPANVHVLKLSGKTVMPGIINGHGHLGLTQGISSGPDNYTEANVTRQIAQYERYGITTVISLGMNKDLLYRLIAEQKQGELGGTTILTADRGIGVPNGVPPVKVGPDQVYRPQSPDEARQDVREMAQREPTLIKIWVDTNLGQLAPPDPAVYGAAIEEAHKLHVHVAAHVYYLADAKRLISDDIDILAHSIRDQELDNDTLNQMRQKGIFYIPTLQLEESFYVYAEHPSWMNEPFFRDATNAELWHMLNSIAYKEKIEGDKTTPVHKAALQMAMTNVKKAHDVGVHIGFGTDSGANPYRIQGFAEHRELQLLVEAGLTPLEALRCATQTNADMLGIASRTGTVARGKTADLLVLDGDPSADVRNTEKIVMVIHQGRIIRTAARSTSSTGAR